MKELKNIMDEPMETSQGEGSPVPEGPEETTPEGVSHEYEQATFSVLLALVPLLVFTLFGQVGLF